jgi:CO/xanthine dehydrogenase Mo-binding subunit
MTWKDVEGARVTTSEGLSEERRELFAKAFARVGSGCGFCLPGLAMRLQTCFEQNPSPSRAMLQGLMSHHICRCTGYQGWLDTIQQMIRPTQPPPQVELYAHQEKEKVQRFNESGYGEPMVERLLAGEPVFVDDLSVPNALEGALGLIERPWGAIQFVDLQRAAQSDGVSSVLTAHELQLFLDGEEEDTFDSDTLPSIPRIRKNVSVKDNIPEAIVDTIPEVLSSPDTSDKDSSGSLQADLEDELPVADQEEASALLSEALALWDQSKESSFGDNHRVERWTSDEALVQPQQITKLLPGPGQDISCDSDVIAMVTASSREDAQRAAKKLRVLVEDVDPQFDAEYAFQRGCAQHIVHQRMSRGDVDQAFRDAHEIVSGTWTTSPVDAICLEPPSCIAIPLEEGRMKIVTSGGVVSAVQEHVAQLLHTTTEHVEVVMMPAGGSFGTRTRPLIEGYAALMAVKEQKPVKLTLPRHTASRMLPKRHAMRIHATLACDEKGNFTGLRMHIFADTGGYPHAASEVLQQALVHACGPYRMTTFELEADAVCSNNPNAGALQNEGVAQVTFALESVIDMLSERVAIDAWALRYRNALQPGDRLPNGQFVGEDCSIATSLEAIRDVYYKHGDSAGLACSLKGCGIWHSPSKTRSVQVHIRAEEDGSYLLLSPFGETGEGTHALLIQAVAELTGLPASAFAIEVSSEGTAGLSHPDVQVGVGALLEAVEDAAKALQKALATKNDLVGQVFIGTKTFHIGEEEPAVHPDLPRYLSFSYAAQVVVLDQSSGRIRRVVTACDIGKPVDIASITLQLDGAVHMGLGYALSEGLELEEGRYVAKQPDELGHIPPQYVPYLHHVLLAQHEKQSLMESQSPGAIAMLPVAPALAAAIFRREGVRHRELPMRSSVTSLTHHPPKIHLD